MPFIAFQGRHCICLFGPGHRYGLAIRHPACFYAYGCQNEHASQGIRDCSAWSWSPVKSHPDTWYVRRHANTRCSACIATIVRLTYIVQLVKSDRGFSKKSSGAVCLNYVLISLVSSSGSISVGLDHCRTRYRHSCRISSYFATSPTVFQIYRPGR